MLTSPNQRIITIKKTVVGDKEHPYTLCVKEILVEAAKELKGNDFKLFMYFYSNKEDWTLGFSPQDVADNWGMSADTARSCFNNLIDKGFIVPSGKNKFKFYDKSQKSNITIKPIVEKRKSFSDNETGEEFKFTYKELLEAVGDKETADTLWKEAEED